ncbi:MAG: DUF2339 domain-containing protein [Phycisphaerales bacterium]|nr:DUF2339 domain-containing protein [Phycisphaerales bacterium]
MTERDISDELRRLSERLDRLERLLDLDPIEVERKADIAAPNEPLRPAPAPPAIVAPAPPSPKPPPPPPTRPAVTFEPVATASLGAPPQRTATNKPAAYAAKVQQRPHREPTNKRGSLEVAIGAKGAAWIGALVIVVACALFIKVAYDAGWFTAVSIATRCAISALFGAILLGCGEFALRKIGRAASVGLFGAGLGTLYVTTLVAFRLEVLGSAGLTLVLLAMVAAIGIGTALRAQMLSIGVIAMIAGYAAPLLVPGAGEFRAALPGYLTMMLLIGLGLSALRPRPFRPLRIVTVAAHGALATLWLFNAGWTGAILELSFITGWWMMITGEAVWAAIRRQSSLGNPIISLFTTAWYAIFGCVLLTTTTTLPAGLTGAFAAGVGVLAAAIAMQFGPGIETLRRRPEIAIEKLAASLWVQAGSLLVVAAALQFRDFGMTIAWLVMGLAAIEVGRHVRSVALDRFGLIVGALGVLRLMSIDLFRGAGVLAFNLGPIDVSQWGLLVLGALAALHLAAWRLRETGSPMRRWTSGALVVISATVWVLAMQIDYFDDGLIAAGAWLLGAAALIAAGAAVIRLPYLSTGVCLALLTVLRLTAVDLLQSGSGDSAFSVGSFAVSQWSVVALCAIVVLNFAAWLVERRGTVLPFAAPTVLIAIAAALWFMATQLDLRDYGVLVTAAWLAGAVALLCAGAAVTRLPYLQVGGVMVAGAALHWLGVDLIDRRSESLEDWIAVWPVLNATAGVGVLIMAAGGLLAWIDRRRPGGAPGGGRGISEPVLYGIGLMLMILLSFEIDRAVAIYEHGQGEAMRERWAPGQLLALWLTLLWGLTGVFTAVFGARSRRAGVMWTGAWAAALCCAAWLVVDTLYFRFAVGGGRAAVVFNLQFFVGLLLAISLGVGVRLMGYRRGEGRFSNAIDARGDFLNVALALIAAIGLWLGSLEIDRFFNPETSALANAAMARLTGLSIYWGVYGIALVVNGFAWRIAESRYAGLALLVITLIKVVAVDMSDVQYIYRVASFMSIGVLFVLTSIAYAKMSPRLLGNAAGDAKPDPEAP